MGHKWPKYTQIHTQPGSWSGHWPVQTFIANCRKDICINLTKPEVFHAQPGTHTHNQATTWPHTSKRAESWKGGNGGVARAIFQPIAASTHSYKHDSICNWGLHKLWRHQQSLNYQFIIDFLPPRKRSKCRSSDTHFLAIKINAGEFRELQVAFPFSLSRLDCVIIAECSDTCAFYWL